MSDNEEEFHEEEVLDMDELFSYLLDNGMIEMVSITEDGVPLYRFSEELMQMEEFFEVHQSITNDMLFSLWNKGYIEMYPINEAGDWRVELCEKSYDRESAKEDLEEDEYLMFVQVFDELSKKGWYN